MYSTTLLNPCPGGGGDDNYFVYPNPSKEEIIITSGQFEVQNGNKKYRVTIVNEQNSIMYQGDLWEREEIKVQVKNWKAGTYFVKLVNGENVKQARLIVEH